MDKKQAQFAHIESYGLKAKKGSGRTTASGVCGEVARVEGFEKHVEQPGEAIFLHGKHPIALLEEIKARDKEQLKEAKEAGRPRPRGDRLVLTGGVYSFPARLTTPEEQLQFMEWQEDCLDFLKAKYGEHLQSVVLHLDESNPHIHFLLCDLKTLRVDGGLDPARTAQYNFRALGKTDGLRQQDALKHWQNEFFESVSKKHGHLRDLGAMKRSRIEGKGTKDVKRALATMKEAGEKLSEIDKKMEALGAKDESLREWSKKMKAGVAVLKTKGEELKAKEQELKERELALQAKEKKAEGMLTKLAELWLNLRAQFGDLMREGDIGQAVKVGERFERFKGALATSRLEREVSKEVARLEAKALGGVPPPEPPATRGGDAGRSGARNAPLASLKPPAPRVH